MKITVTQRIEIDGHVEEYSASAEVEIPIILAFSPNSDGAPIEMEDDVATRTAKALFESLP